jgi:hypothetical protein
MRTWRALAGPEQDVIFRQGARARPVWPVQLRRHECPRRHRRRCRAGTSAIPLPARLLGL